MPDVVVAGGGIAGLTISLALASRGRRVVVIDEARPGAASIASAGMLAPSIGFAPGIRERAIAARDCYPAFLAALHDVTEITVPLDRRGILELVNQDDAGHAARRASASPGARWLDERALLALEPLLHPGFVGVLHPGDGAVDAGVLMEALTKAVARSAHVRRLHAAVVAVEIGEREAWATTGDGARVGGRHLVIATGAWARQPSGLPRPLPVRPVHGELLRLAGAAPGHVIHGPDGYLIPRGGTVLVGATSAENGFRAAPTDGGRAALLAAAARMLPALAGVPVVAHWAGLRPVTPDGLPILGRDPDRPALVYACGGSRNGILFGPWAAERISEEMAGATSGALDPFRVERFAGRERPEPAG
ncbi:MAG: putative glycine oxidase precursor [Gemmatimonadetes bacterium]|nr:putative glycine oxidase precursor [Gemmatimonadota bacterium]